MSSQSIRNEINTSIRRVITDVKRKVILEGNKKIMELKDQLLNPNQIIKMLSADISQDSCSTEGRNKMKEKADQLKTQLNQIDEIAQKGLTAMINLEEKIGGISSKIEIPNVPNPIENIQSITDALKIPMKLLKIVIRIAPAILGSQVSVPGAGGPVSGTLITQTNNNVNLAKAKIAEFTNLFTALPRVLDSYIAKANIVFDKITKIKNQIQTIVNEIAKLNAFIIYLELDFESKCNEFLENQTATDNNIVIEPTVLPWPEGPLTLADVIAQTEELYGDILKDLIARGDNKAIRRIYTLGAQLQRIKNIKVEVINI